MIAHSWDISTAEAIALQRRLADQVVSEPLPGPVRTVAGVDCAFVDERGRGGRGAWGRTEGVRVLAAAVLCDVETMGLLAVRHVVRPCRFPYVPGLLSFREGPAAIEAVRRLPSRPDLLMCDGQGVAHPRRLGLASHVGLWLELPTMGVAKSLLVGEHRPVGHPRGSQTPLSDRGEVIGAAVRTRTGVKCVYVSVGHRIALADAVQWALRCCRGVRLPQPCWQAHRQVTDLARSLRSRALEARPLGDIQ